MLNELIQVGKVFYTNQKNSEWKIWHEIMSIDGGRITISNYGKDVEIKDVVLLKKEIRYCIKKGILIPA